LRFAKPFLIIFLILLADQALKFWVKTNLFLGEEIHVIGNWFKIHFTENEGMAFGLQIGGEYGKLMLSLFRIIALLLIGYYLIRLIKKQYPTGLIVSISLILAGALGNIIDSTFYGLLFSESTHKVAALLPPEGGYASLMHGRVVDMFYFPLFQGYLPDWVPFWGGDYFIFFRPVFNIADAAITVGVLMIILFQRRYFNEPLAGDQPAGGQEALSTTTAEESETPESTDASEEVPPSRKA